MPKKPEKNNDIIEELFGIDEGYAGMKKTPPFLEYTHWQQLKERILVINNVVEDYLIDEILIPIMDFNRQDEGIDPDKRKPIKIYINTDGGNVDIALAIVSAIQASKTPVHTYVLGKAYSAGSIILIAGHKRFAFEYSNILIHEGSLGVRDSASKTEDFLKYSKKQNEKIKELIVGRTKIPEKVYNKKLREEWYFFGSEGKELGVIDEIVTEL